METTAAVSLGILDVMDLNDHSDMFGTHTITLDADRFEAVADTDGNGSTWTIWIKEGAEFDYEEEGVEMGVLKVKVTATDGGGKKVEAYFSITVTNDTVDDATSSVGSGGIAMGSNTVDDDDAPGTPPGDGVAFIDIDDVHVLNIETDDLLDSFVLAIDDIDVA